MDVKDDEVAQVQQAPQKGGDCGILLLYARVFVDGGADLQSFNKERKIIRPAVIRKIDFIRMRRPWLATLLAVLARRWRSWSAKGGERGLALYTMERDYHTAVARWSWALSGWSSTPPRPRSRNRALRLDFHHRIFWE